MNRKYRKALRNAAVYMSAAILALHPALVQAQTSIGSANKIVAAVNGVLQANTRTLVVKDAVYSNEVINTGAASAARFVFQDNTLLSVGANSSVTLDEFVFDADAAKSKVALSMAKGVMRFVSGSLPKKVYSIRTPTALIGIRGTTLIVTVAANGLTTVSVVEGVATVSAAGTTATVNSGFTTTVAQGAPPAPPAPSPPAPPQVQSMQASLGPDPGVATGGETTGLGGLSAGAIAGAAAVAAAIAVAIGAAASDSDSINTTDASSSTSTATQ